METVTATAGGGAIKVVMTGDQKCQSVEINPDLLKDADAEMLQDLVLSAVNMALDQSRELQRKVDGSAGGWIAILRILNGTGHLRDCNPALLGCFNSHCDWHSRLFGCKKEKNK